MSRNRDFTCDRCGVTATDELRRLLDERGVEYEVDDGKTVRVTRWKAYGEWVSFIEYDTGETRFCTDMRRFTPAQAIAATLGSGTCEMEYVNDWMGWHCKSCDNLRMGLPDQKPKYCPNCGRKVVDE